ncbi:MAG: hypothetical protein AB7F25_13280 [Deferribacterales bacterium]
MEQNLRETIGQDIFDYQMLMNALKEYVSPRDKITRLLKSGEIIQLRKGLYIFHQAYRKQSLSREIIANMIYGPSYISFEYALSYYGIIPERVNVVTSAALGRTRSYDTPLGVFSYRMLPADVFSIGVDIVESFHIATPAKALADKVAYDSNLGIRTAAGMADYLQAGLRADVSDIDLSELAGIGQAYRMTKIKLLEDAVRRIKDE